MPNILMGALLFAAGIYSLVFSHWIAEKHVEIEQAIGWPWEEETTLALSRMLNLGCGIFCAVLGMLGISGWILFH
ncbi:MAG: hypothetical protein IVW54_00715 [Candidatus Binataceae bacterium]|nr:hypothetical protein [Candidatus Binataceae bacterium]